MKTLLVSALLVLSASGNAFAQDYGRVTLWADPTHSSCEIVDPGSGIVQVHMFFEGSQPASAVEFFAPTPQCWEGTTWLGDVLASPFLKGGVSTHSEGIAVNFLSCVEPPAYLGYMSFLVSGGALPCCEYPVLPQTVHNRITFVSCDFQNEYAGGGGSATVNANNSCRCPLPVATEPTTWGRVKSLYR